jgi:hypothetical protein
MLRTVVIDIEGTTGATAFVTGRLYPYSAARFATWIDGHADDPDVTRAIAQVRKLIGNPAARTSQIVAALADWLAADEKSHPAQDAAGQDLGARLRIRRPGRALLPGRDRRPACVESRWPRALHLLLGVGERPAGMVRALP